MSGCLVSKFGILLKTPLINANSLPSFPLENFHPIDQVLQTFEELLKKHKVDVQGILNLEF
jgi:hypothetical protein